MESSSCFKQLERVKEFIGQTIKESYFDEEGNVILKLESGDCFEITGNCYGSTSIYKVK